MPPFAVVMQLYCCRRPPAGCKCTSFLAVAGLSKLLKPAVDPYLGLRKYLYQCFLPLKASVHSSKKFHSK